MALDFPPFLQVGEHHNGGWSLLPHQPPEVHHCILQWTCGNNLLPYTILYILHTLYFTCIILHIQGQIIHKHLTRISYLEWQCISFYTCIPIQKKTIMLEDWYVMESAYIHLSSRHLCSLLYNFPLALAQFCYCHLQTSV